MTVVVLGNRLASPEIHDRLKGRMDIGIEVFRREGARNLVLSGAATNPDVPAAECEVMEEYAIEQGVDPASIYLDDRAGDTIGNGFFTRLLVEDFEDVDTVYVVSSCYHMERAAFVFEQCYGPGYHVDSRHCYETDVPAERLHEEESLEEAREFFRPIEPGDIDAIRDRLIETHALYDSIPLGRQ